ncbi:MAG: VOC family protein [Geminicoccaceae bacterium]|nr:MAG: VOC family protein [Geminicoccaceae bacterium]
MHAQLPAPGEVFLDHVAWFVAEMAAAERALQAMGFTLTPFTRQMNQTQAGPVPAGMANRLAMLPTGYMEFLTAVADSPLARQFHTQLERYAGLHLLAFTVADAAAEVRRLRRQGFPAQEPVALRRPVSLGASGTAEAAFTVVRVPPEAMPEGRIQLLTHHTPEVVWQSRWIRHPNAVQSLEAVLLAVAEPVTAAERFVRFLDRPAVALGDGRWMQRLDRGMLVFAPRAWVEAEVAPLPSGVAPPVIAAVALGSADLAVTSVTLAAAGAEAWPGAYALPSALGGAVTLTAPGDAPAWAR